MTLPYGGVFGPDLPSFAFGAARTPFGVLLPPHVRVAAYLRSSGASDLDPPEIQNNLATTLASALSRCRSGSGDVIYVLPGHTENVSTATAFANVVAGTRIIGAGNPRASNAPKFTWTATAAQWAVDVADVSVENLKLDLTGIDAVVEAISVEADGFNFSGNHVVCETTSLQAVAAIGMNGGDRCSIIGNSFYGTGSDDVTTAIDIDAAADGDELVIENNTMVGGWHASLGAINVGGAVKGMLIDKNRIVSLFAGTVCIAVADVASTGLVTRNLMGVRTDGTTAASAKGIVVTGATSELLFSDNYCTDEFLASGILSPVAAT